MYQNDYILREIEGLTRVLANVLFRRDLHQEEIVNEQHQVSGVGLFRHVLFQMLSDGKINEAENLLHEQLQTTPYPEYLQLGLDFYAELARVSDQELEAHHFSREEIAEGLSDLKQVFDLSENQQKG